jgi:hypothetical protein
MTLLTLQQDLENSAGKKVQVKINDNHSTMLSVKWEPDCTRVSLHRMFLTAPQNIMDELACYLRQDSPTMSNNIKAFIEDNVQKLDYSHTLKQRNLYQQGNVYNLKQIYDDINQEYFKNKLNLSITWFGKSNQRNRTRVTFGLYHDPLRLIKIHRLLDSPIFPDYLVDFVVYHEMLHHVCPPYVDKKGLHQIHSKEFKEKEMEFQHYGLAQKWIKDHQKYFFKDLSNCKENSYGRT